MKKLTMIICLLAAFAMGAYAQEPWKIIDMEDVVKHGSHCDFDDETCTAEFTGSQDRWFDLPGVSGDLTGHTKLDLEILKSTCILKICVRYKDADGKTQQVTAVTPYSQMGKTIESKKIIKVDLADKGKVSEEMLKNVTSIRIAMAKAVDGNEEPWTVQFGNVAIY